MMDDNTTIAALVGLLAALIGGAIQAISARSLERLKNERESKWDLYSKYFLVLGELSFSESGTERHLNALSLMAQLRGRIGVIGSPKVIESVGNVFRFSDLNSVEAQDAMASALDAMRKDIGGTGRNVSRKALLQLMFGSGEK